MSSKALIERFYKTFAKVRLIITYRPDDPHDLLDDDYDGPRRPFQEEVSIEQICHDHLGLPWYPGLAFNCRSEEEQDQDAAKVEAEATLMLAAFDAYWVDRRKVDEEAAKLEFEEGRSKRLAFNAEAKEKYPILHGHRGLLDWILGLDSFVKDVPKMLDITNRKERLKAYKGFIGTHTNSDGIIHIETPKESVHRKAEEQRKRLERDAASLARKMGCQVSSMKFIRGLYHKIGRHRSRREGLREDGLCATAYPGSMRGYEQWCEMDQDEQSAISHVHEILDWLRENCPLLWCKWEERQLRRKQEKNRAT